MSSAYFSIVIPTRNRPELLRDAITSALQQDFDDFEVIVSDNFNDESTQNVLNTFQDNPKLRIYRTEKLLSMPDHWEFATRKAQGEYVLILPDRSVLKHHALKTIHAAIKHHNKPVKICSWGWSLFDGETHFPFADTTINKNKASIFLESKQLANNFAQGMKTYPYALPRALNSCYHRELMARVQAKYGTPFKPLSPDFFSAFVFLGETREILFINQALFISQGLTSSNGGSYYDKGGVDYLNSLGNVDWYSHVPIKANLVENFIFQDFIAAQQLVGGNLQNITLNWPFYFESCYKEILHKKGMGFLPKKDIQTLLNEWIRALQTFDQTVQAKTYEKIKSLRWFKFKTRLKRSFLAPYFYQLKKIHARIKNKNFPRGSAKKHSVLSSAGF